MAKRTINFDDVLNYIEKLPYNMFKEVIEHYSSNNKSNFEKDLDIMVTRNFEQRLDKLNINKTCPKCNSANIKKDGKRPSGIQRLKCKDCSTKFTLFTGTILEKSKWHWDIWIKVFEMTLNGYSINSMLNVLREDYGCSGINVKTVWQWRLKFIVALASFPMPKLTGVVQIDETFIRESQKGSRTLLSYLDKTEIRKPRYGYKPSKYGVMGPEFATVTTAIDNNGYCVCKVSNLGKLTKEIFTDLFEEHLNMPAYICSDANDVYESYCKLFDIPHYVKPSNYQAVIYRQGYERPDFTNTTTLSSTTEKNNKILTSLYKENLIDKITNRGFIPFEEFQQIKLSNSLSLARVNELHSDIKKFIYKDMTNVSTQYLNYYIGFFTYIRNWRVKNGHYPNSQKDAESIFIDIIKSKVNYTISDINSEKLVLPKPTTRYITLLKNQTVKARLATGNKYFKFDEEDGFKTFNKREYLLDQPKSKLYAICKECKLTKYKQLALWCLVSLILKQPNIDDIIYKLLVNDRHYTISDEDLNAIKSSQYNN